MNYNIIVHRIEFFNRTAGNGTRTRDAQFRGTHGIPLGQPFVGVNTDLGRSVIEVGGTRTNVIRLEISSNHGSNTPNVGAAEIIIHATVCTGNHPVHKVWEQPIWNAPTHPQHGTVSSNRPVNNNAAPWMAFNGVFGGQSNGQWSVNNVRDGWLELRLNYYITVYQIEFFNRTAGNGTRTKDADFRLFDNTVLRQIEPFTAVNSDLGRSVIEFPGGIRTNVIRLQVHNNFGSNTPNIGAAKIRIHATVV